MMGLNDNAVPLSQRKRSTREPVADLEYEQFRQGLVDGLYADSREQPVRKTRKGRRGA